MSNGNGKRDRLTQAQLESLAETKDYSSIPAGGLTPDELREVVELMELRVKAGLEPPPVHPDTGEPLLSVEAEKGKRHGFFENIERAAGPQARYMTEFMMFGGFAGGGAGGGAKLLAKPVMRRVLGGSAEDILRGAIDPAADMLLKSGTNVTYGGIQRLREMAKAAASRGYNVKGLEDAAILGSEAIARQSRRLGIAFAKPSWLNPTRALIGYHPGKASFAANMAYRAPGPATGIGMAVGAQSGYTTGELQELINEIQESEAPGAYPGMYQGRPPRTY